MSGGRRAGGYFKQRSVRSGSCRKPEAPAQQETRPNHGMCVTLDRQTCYVVRGNGSSINASLFRALELCLAASHKGWSWPLVAMSSSTSGCLDTKPRHVLKHGNLLRKTTELVRRTTGGCLPDEKLVWWTARFSRTCLANNSFCPDLSVEPKT